MQAIIFEFAKEVLTFMYDVLDASSLECRLRQCGAIVYECTMVRNLEEDAAPFDERLNGLNLQPYPKAFLRWMTSSCS